jgi:hypothetical protein
LNIDRDALKQAFADYAARKTLCCAPGCQWGYVAPDPEDIDPFTEEPRREPCKTCDGSGHVDRQMDMFAC